MAIKRAKGSKGACDAIFSRIIRSLGYCLSCGDSDYAKLQCAHIVSRRYSATRCHLPNAIPLCWTCHRRYTDWPLEFNKFVEEKVGLSVYEELKAMAEVTTKMDWDEKLIELKEVAKEKGIK